MTDKKKANNKAVQTYHKKLTNLAIIRVPTTDREGNYLEYKKAVAGYIEERYGKKSMNEYLLDLIQNDMNQWYEAQGNSKRISFAKGVKDLK